MCGLVIQCDSFRVMGPLMETVEDELRKRLEEVYMVKLGSLISCVRKSLASDYSSSDNTEGRVLLGEQEVGWTTNDDLRVN